MFTKSFKSKIILPAIVSLAVLAVTLTSFTITKFLSYSENFINEKMISNANTLELVINDFKNHSKMAAVSMALDPKAIEAIKNHDREKILSIFASVHDLYKINFCTIMDDKGTVLVRMHEPDNFGDNLSKQQNVKDALSGKTSSYFEEGTVVKVSVRTGAPVYDSDGKLVGAISAGFRFDTEEAVDELKKLLNTEISIFFGDTRIVTTIFRDGKRASGTKLDSSIVKIVVEGKNTYFGDANVLGEKYKTFYMPLLNAKNEAFASFVTGMPKLKFEKEVNALIQRIIIIGFVGLMIIAVLLYFIISTISRPIIKLSREMDSIESGNLDVVIDVKGSDEVGRAGESLQKMVNTINRLIKDINTSISEYENGNADYEIDADAFQGHYRLLVNNIIDLSNIGMRDTLTKIPNRRIFDNRLNLEWARAKREKTPLSFLMIDVDRFKSYNDNYGHQQGDVVLQVIAKVLTGSIKRAIDFVARWGGEEFVILLPNTDLNGAILVAEQIRAVVENTEIPSIDGSEAKRVTVSIGMATQIPSSETKIGDLISKADSALYHAKETGRNRVCKFEKFGQLSLNESFAI